MSLDRSDLTSKVMKQIQGRRPIPKYRLWLSRHAVGLFYGVTLVIGALALGLWFESIWPEREVEASIPWLPMVLGGLPLLWVSVLVAGVLLGIWVFRLFRYGYRVRTLWIVLLSLGVIAGGSIWFYQQKWTDSLQGQLMNRFPVYQGLFENQRQMRWMDPARGRLSGVVQTWSQGQGVLVDWQGKHWTFVSPDSLMAFQPQDTVRLRGQFCPDAENAQKFCVWRAMPWMPRGGGMGGGPHGPGWRRGPGPHGPGQGPRWNRP